MQINTLRAQVIHKEKYQPRKNVCLTPDQTRKTRTKETAGKFIKIWHKAVLVPCTLESDATNPPNFFKFIFSPTSCFTLPKADLWHFGLTPVTALLSSSAVTPRLRHFAQPPAISSAPPRQSALCG